MIWITNLANPYRLPVWDCLAEDDAFRVLLLSDTEPGRQWERYARGRPYLRRLRTKRVALRGGQYYFPLEAVRPHLVGHRVSVLGGWESPVYWLALLNSRGLGLRTVGFYESHGESHSFKSGPVVSARKKFFGSLDGVVVPGRASEETILSIAPEVPRYRTVNAVDNALVQKVSASARSGIVPASGEPHRFVYVGQLIVRKRVDVVIRSLAAVPNAVLTIVGGGPEEKALRECARIFGVDDRVFFAGQRDYVSTLEEMSRAHTLVLASDTEVWGMVVNEALIAGLGVVVSRTAGVVRDVEGMSGVRVFDGRTADLVRQMRISAANWRGWRGHSELEDVSSPRLFADKVLEASAPAM